MALEGFLGAVLLMRVYSLRTAEGHGWCGYEWSWEEGAVAVYLRVLTEHLTTIIAIICIAYYIIHP